MRSENDTIEPTDAMGQWKQISNEGGRKTGRPFDIYASGLQRKALEEAGFVEIVEKDIRVRNTIFHVLHERALVWSDAD